MKKQWAQAAVAADCDVQHSFVADTGNGLLRRNRRHIMPSNITPPLHENSAGSSDKQRRIPHSDSMATVARNGGIPSTRSGRIVKPPLRIHYE